MILVAEFISPPKVYTFSFIVGSIIPKSLQCIHSATKGLLAGGGCGGVKMPRVGSMVQACSASRNLNRETCVWIPISWFGAHI